jgi:hypothetical protein
MEIMEVVMAGLHGQGMVDEEVHIFSMEVIILNLQIYKV